MVQSIADSIELFATHNVMQEPTREMALGSLSRYEKNIAKGKVYNASITKSINKIYTQWGIEVGCATEIMKEEFDEQQRILIEEKIDSRFDILDL